MQPGWMVNTATGEDIIDAKKSAEGLLLPIGGYKGSGLAIMLGLLAGPLNRAVFGRDVVDFNADDKSETTPGISSSRWTSRGFCLWRTHREVDRHIRELKNRSVCLVSTKSACRASGGGKSREERTRDGLPLSARWWRSWISWRGAVRYTAQCSIITPLVRERDPVLSSGCLAFAGMSGEMF